MARSTYWVKLDRSPFPCPKCGGTVMPASKGVLPKVCADCTSPAVKAAQRYKARNRRKTEADRAWMKKKSQDYRAWTDRIKLASGCVDCGYREDPANLHFHHIDPSTKLFSVAIATTASRKKVLAEMKKCVVLCNPCHRARHKDLNRKRKPPVKTKQELKEERLAEFAHTISRATQKLQNTR